MEKQIDVIIASLPFIETDEPMMAPAILKSIVNKTNYTSKTFDFNMECIKKINSLEEICKEKVVNWFLYKDNDDDSDVLSFIDLLANEFFKKIISYNPKFVCLSLFCNNSRPFNTRLCTLIKNYSKEIKIIIGGNGVYSEKTNHNNYAKILKLGKIIDYYVMGDGEEPLLEILLGNISRNYDRFQILKNLNNQEFPDYSDYEWEKYTLPRIPMYGSRGCVRKCTFCDVHKLWKDFNIRTAEDVFNEMLYQIKLTGFKDFYFRDSLVNGSMSEYRKLITYISDYNANTDEKIKWTGFAIFRPKNQMTEKDWELTGSSGAYNLAIGIESFVEKIRYHMKKKFSNQDMDFGLQMALKYNVSLIFLMIIGYINETKDDFIEALTWLENNVKYKEIISQISAGGTLTVTDLTDLYINNKDYNITIGSKIYLWENNNINLDYNERIYRKETFINKAKSLGYKIVSSDQPVT